MIRLYRTTAPQELTVEETSRLTDLYKVTNESVWQKNFIKEALLKQSHNKCSFCECELNIESNYMEVEHFANKSAYPEKVVCWENLLASCKRCNTTKGAHDTEVEPLINPYIDEPREHLSLKAYRMQPLTEKGELSIEVLGLNNTSKAAIARFKIGMQICRNLDDIEDKIRLFLEKGSTLRKRKLLNAMDSLLRECLATAPYAATASTVLHKESIYPRIKLNLESLGVWDDQLQLLHDSSSLLAL